MNNYLIIGLASFSAMIAVFWIYFKMLRIARDKNLVDNPDARKLQKEPVPVVGGLSVFFGVLFAILVGSCMMDCTGLVPILMAMSVMIYLGALDDLFGLSPKFRLFIEIIVMLALIYGGGGCIDSFHGLWGIEDFSWFIAVPVTVFAGVGIINAVNMIDGVNGLSSGLCITMSFIFGYTLFKGDDFPNALLCFSMAAGLIPFVIHNVAGKTTKMFIGDAGTMSMGVLMAWCVMQMLRSDTPARWMEYQLQGTNLVAITLAILSVPVFDTLRVMFLRVIKGGSPFKADKTHLHHILYIYSHSHSLTSLTEILLDFFIVCAWALSASLKASMEVQFFVVVGLSVFFVWGLYFYLDQNNRLNTGVAFRLRRFMAVVRQGDKDWWKAVQNWVDTPHMRSQFKE